MPIWVIRYVIVGVLLAVATGCAAGPPAPPVTRIEVVTDRMHGIDIPDPSYRWLEDQQSPETRAWIADQNAYTRATLDAIPNLGFGRDFLWFRVLRPARDGLPVRPRYGGAVGMVQAEPASELGRDRHDPGLVCVEGWHARSDVRRLDKGRQAGREPSGTAHRVRRIWCDW